MIHSAWGWNVNKQNKEKNKYNTDKIKLSDKNKIEDKNSDPTARKKTTTT